MYGAIIPAAVEKAFVIPSSVPGSRKKNVFYCVDEVIFWSLQDYSENTQL